MNLNSVQNVQTSAGAASSAANSKPAVNADAFMTLLIAELKNQDPTQPMDPAQMVSQLATVSQVTQMTQMNATLSQILGATSLSQAGQVIGKTATSEDGTVSGRIVSVTLASAGPVATLDDGSQLSLTNGVRISA